MNEVLSEVEKELVVQISTCKIGDNKKTCPLMQLEQEATYQIGSKLSTTLGKMEDV